MVFPIIALAASKIHPRQQWKLNSDADPTLGWQYRCWTNVEPTYIAVWDITSPPTQVSQLTERNFCISWLLNSFKKEKEVKSDLSKFFLVLLGTPSIEFFVDRYHHVDDTMKIQGAAQVLRDNIYSHYNDVIMTTMASQITSLTVVYSTVYSDADQRKHQSSASLAFVWEIHRGRWIPRTKGQLRGKCFHLMTSSC